MLTLVELNAQRVASLTRSAALDLVKTLNADDPDCEYRVSVHPFDANSFAIEVFDYDGYRLGYI